MVAFGVSRGGLVFGGCHLVGLGGWVVGFSDARDLTIFFFLRLFSDVLFLLRFAPFLSS